MEKMNNKGFTLIEVLAVIVILSVLTAIMVPSVNYIINMNKENNYEDLKSGFIQATKVLFSDYRYEVSVIGSCDSLDEQKELEISSVGDYNLTNLIGASRVPIQVLVDENNVSVNQAGNIVDPRNTKQVLDLNESYILVKYQCKTKDFRYEIEKDQDGKIIDYLVWK